MQLTICRVGLYVRPLVRLNNYSHNAAAKTLFFQLEEFHQICLAIDSSSSISGDEETGKLRQVTSTATTITITIAISISISISSNTTLSAVGFASLR